MKQTVVLTGASGFLGSGILRALVEQGAFEIVSFHRPGSRSPDVGERSLAVDLADETAVAEALAAVRPCAIIHAAGRVSGTPLELFRDNTVATVSLANAIARTIPDCRMIALGSAAEYGPPKQPGPVAEAGPYEPVSVYGHSKLAGARYLAAAHQQRGLQYDYLLVFNVVGIKNSTAQVIGAFIAKAAALTEAAGPQVIPMGRLDAVRDFVTVDDVAHVVLRLMAEPARNAPMNVCSGKGRGIRDLIQLLVQESGTRFRVEEQGGQARSGGPDIVIGDPRLCLAVIAPRQLDCVEDTLREALRLAIGDRSR